MNIRRGLDKTEIDDIISYPPSRRDDLVLVCILDFGIISNLATL